MDKNKHIIIASLIGTATILGLYYYYSKEEDLAISYDNLSDLDKELIKKIKDLGIPPKDKDGNISFNYLYKFCDIVGQHTKHAEDFETQEMVK